MRACKKILFVIFASILLWSGGSLGQSSANEALRQKTREKEGETPSNRSKGSPAARDPFLLPAAVKPLSEISSAPQSPAAAPQPSFELRAILLSDRLRLASINRQIVRVGDRIEGEQVVAIEADQVILEKEGKRRILFLSRSPIHLTVETNERKEKNR